MKNRLIILLFCSFAFKGICQDSNLYKSDTTIGTFKEELNKFIDKTNKRDLNICKYYVYVIYMYPISQEQSCYGYTISYIFNYDEYDDVKPEYYFSDSANIILIKFNPEIKNKDIPGLILKKINDDDKNKILSKLPPKSRYGTGISDAFIYNICGKKKEIIYYENSDNIPKEKSILRNFIFDNFKVIKIYEGVKVDSVLVK